MIWDYIKKIKIDGKVIYSKDGTEKNICIQNTETGICNKNTCDCGTLQVEVLKHARKC